MTMLRNRSFPIAFFCLCLFVSAASYSQVLDRGDIVGTVTDETGAALPGATVTVTHVETGLTRVVTTDGEGRYTAKLLPVGRYVLVAELPAFATVTREGVVVEVGSAPVIDITMPLATVTEAITVTAASPVVETRRAVTATTVNQTAIATLPINGRDFRDFALLSPNAQVTPGLRSPLRFGGQQGDYSVINIDGADFTNPFFAEYSGSLETKNFAISQEAVQEFQVLTNGFNAEYGRSTGGVINVVTKSGTNDWRGSGFTFLRDEALTADDPFGNAPNEFSQQQFGGSVGGPIARDKAFFFFAADLQNRSAPVTTRFNRDVSGIAIPEFGIADFADLEGQHPSQQDLVTLFGRVDADLSKNHRFTVRVNYANNDSTNFTGGRGQAIVAAAENNFEDFTNEALSVVTSITSVIGTRAFNEFKYQYVHESRPREAKSDDPEINIADTCTAGCFGREFFLPITSSHVRHQFVDSFNYLFGDHDLKFGVDWNSTELSDNKFIGFASGAYFFASLEGFEARQPIGLAQRVFLNGFNPDNVELDGYWQHELGLFIQDTWQPKPNLTVNYGVRYEAQNHDDPRYPTVGNTGEIPLVRQAPGTDLRPVPQTIKDDKNNFGPRLGVSWDPNSDGKTVIRGAVGIYYGRTASIFLPTAGSGYRDSALFMFPPPVEYPGLLPSVVTPGETPPVAIPPPTIGFVSEEFENPRVFNLNIGGETEILPNLSIGADFIYSKSNNLRIGSACGCFITFDQNTFPPTGADQYGRPIGIDAGFVDTDGDGQILRRPDPTAGLADMLSSLGRAEYRALVVKAKKGFSDRTQFFGSYTISKDESNADTERDTDVFLGAANPYDVEAEYGIDERDIRHRFIVSGTTEVGAGFTLSGILNLRSGRPYPAYTLTDVNGDGQTLSRGNNYDRAVDASGNVLPRFPYRQPAFYNFDVRVMWSRGLGDGGNLDLLFETFNLFNNGNLETNIFTIEAANFGSFNTFVGTQRTAQLGIKYRF